jgi:hypothetical protein
VDVLWSGKWWAATILAVQPAGRYKVHYACCDRSWDEVVDASRVARPGSHSNADALPTVQEPTSPSSPSRWHAGDRVEIEAPVGWSPGSVVAVRPGGQYAVHFTCCASTLDETVDEKYLRAPTGGEPTRCDCDPSAPPAR